ncbi:serine hydrolase domain-containing protein [Streptomyces pacificus]|uniref:Serine hydrolase n=1 Tax=Streptomyces pacificus TaxID=2705029 RepID=A0A6A0B0D1_9ACTN|nr:serine hydrolase domain-containing protein [Streptomyces pacificus]GFH38670.1 serine hydrolase [Streptomyces pacificus]
MTSPREALLPGTERALLHRVAVAQSEGRAPSLVGAVVRDGGMVWSGSRSGIGEGAPGADTQYRIGSLTKTFTAVLVMRLRDEGLLDLGDPLEGHLPGTGVGEATIAQLLSHTAGLAAESPAPWWERTPGSVRPELADVLGEHPRIHPAGRRHHYSNTGYALLGSLVEAVRRRPWEEVLRSEVLEPLGMGRTSCHPGAPHASGWAVHPWADAVMHEPAVDLGLMAPAGQLWSTAADLCRFAGFLAEGGERVLGAGSLREMRTSSAPAEPGDWDSTYGLGLQIVRRNGQTLVGHAGSLPGFVACLWADVQEGVAAVVLGNATSGPLPAVVAADLVHIVVDAEPRFPEPWRPMQEVDGGLLELTGAWYWGTSPFGLKLVADRGLELYPLSGPGRGSRFRARPDGSWRGLDGYFAGETLRAVHGPEGRLIHLDLGSFAFTREPYDPAGGVPGGVDARGWCAPPS